MRVSYRFISSARVGLSRKISSAGCVTYETTYCSLHIPGVLASLLQLDALLWLTQFSLRRDAFWAQHTDLDYCRLLD
jgi:hypothetical protein